MHTQAGSVGDIWRDLAGLFPTYSYPLTCGLIQNLETGYTILEDNSQGAKVGMGAKTPGDLEICALRKLRIILVFHDPHSGFVLKTVKVVCVQSERERQNGNNIFGETIHGVEVLHCRLLELFAVVDILGPQVGSTAEFSLEARWMILGDFTPNGKILLQVRVCSKFGLKGADCLVAPAVLVLFFSPGH